MWSRRRLAACGESLLAVALYLWAAICPCSGALQVEGRIQVSAYAPSGQLATNHNFGFRLTQAGRQWNIRVEYGPDWYEETGCDGTNVCSLVECPGKRIVNPTRVPLQMLTNSVPGTIVEGVYPLNQNWHTTIPWFVFCAPLCGYELGDTNFPVPWSPARHEVMSGVFDLRVEQWMERPGGFIERAQWERASEHQERALRHPWLVASFRAQDWRRLLEQYPPGFVGAEYEVLSTLNAEGRKLPATFALRRYLPHPGIPSQRWLLQKFEGVVEQVRSVAANGFLPVTQKLIAVGDFRLHDRASGVDNVTCESSNGIWPLTITSALSNKLASDVYDAKYVKSIPLRNSFGGKLIVVAIIFLFLVPPLYWAWRRRQAQLTPSPVNKTTL